MFFGNMQSFYRRNSVHSQSSSHGTQTKPSKDHVKRFKHLSNTKTAEDDEDEHSKHNPIRRRSFSISRNREYEEHLDEFSQNNIQVPIIKIGLHEPEPSKKSFNILKEKEKALWFNSCSESDNSERLGPNTNNIIEESLESERRQKNYDCAQ